MPVAVAPWSRSACSKPSRRPDAGGQVLRAGQVGDAPATGEPQVIDRELHRQAVVADHRRHAARVVGPVDHAPRCSPDATMKSISGSSRDAMASTMPSTCCASMRSTIGRAIALAGHVGHQHEGAARRGMRFDALQDRREHRVGDVGHQHADGVRAAGAQRRRGAVGPVAEPARGGFDRRHHLGAHAAGTAPVERARHGGHVHAGGPCHVADGDGGRVRCGARGFASEWLLLQTVAARWARVGRGMC